MVDMLVDAEESHGDLAHLEQEIRSAGLARTEVQPKSKGRQAPKTEQQDEEDADIPDKYRGKSLRDVIEMHRNLETQYGRQSNDLGTQRHMTDILLGLKRERDLQQNSDSADEKVEIKGDELLANPTEALERVIAPRERKQAERLDAVEQQLAATRFAGRHPDYTEYTNDPEFKTWIAASPLRARAAVAAANGAWDVAGDLLDDYKAHKAASRKTSVQEEEESENSEQEEQHPLKLARSASLESSSQGNSNGGSKGKKIYKRADIMRIRIKNPELYYSEEFQAEIMPAYSEGRVR